MLRTLILCIFLGVSGEDCTNCAPAQSAALLQSSVHRDAKKHVGPRILSPAHFYGPGPYKQFLNGPNMHPSMAHMTGIRMQGPMGRFNRFNSSLVKKVKKEKKENEESTYGGSTYGGGGAEKITPCSSPAHFQPNGLMSMPWCDLWAAPQPVEKDACEAMDGCRYSYGYCNCEVEASCLGLGGSWHAWTCQDEIDGWAGANMDMLENATAAGTCEGFEVHGWKAEDMVGMAAGHCCNNYPSTFCEPNIRPMTPCKDSDDFLAESLAWAWCDLYEANPSKEQCDDTPGCTEEWGYCSCKTEASCKSLGGHFQGGKCKEELKYWYPNVHKAVAEALDKETCHGVEAGYSDVKYSVDYLGHSCCSTGKSVCEELDHYDSGYSSYY